MLDELVTTFTTLFVVVDPPGLGPIFLALTSGMTLLERRAVAIRATLIALAVLAGTALFGEWLLRQLGIGLPAFRIAGGLLLFAIAFEMVFERRLERKANTATAVSPRELASSLAAFPLAIPLMAGPGAITATVLLAGRAGDARGLAGLLVVIAVVVGSCLAVFLFASRIERWLGKIGQIVLARLLGVLLAALAVQFVIDGATSLLRG